MGASAKGRCAITQGWVEDDVQEWSWEEEVPASKMAYPDRLGSTFLRAQLRSLKKVKRHIPSGRLRETLKRILANVKIFANYHAQQASNHSGICQRLETLERQHQDLKATLDQILGTVQGIAEQTARQGN
ncbi:hypothetical protein ACLX1H_010879 [Fusarium chlamydosporum]